MARQVLISGLGPVSGLGVGIEPNWDGLMVGRSAVDTISRFDAAGFDCRIGADVGQLRTSQFVPRTYRKAIKVMARDIELAVMGADLAARDAGLATKGTGLDDRPASYEPSRVGCHIGAGLITADLNELTSALVSSRSSEGPFDMRHWGREGMKNLYPLWLLKYLPNMLACHVSIIHDTQGPSNTITCGDSSATLSIGESFRVIQRGAADLCFCGGTDSKLNPMAFLRQLLAGRLTTEGNDAPAQAVRPFCRTATGTAVGEGGGILMLEAANTYHRRGGGSQGHGPYAEIVGFGASQTLHHQSRNLLPDPAGSGIELAIRSALGEAAIEPEKIDLIVPFAIGLAASDQAEVHALRRVFGAALGHLHVAPIKGQVGNCSAGAGVLDACAAACALSRQTVPAIINCNNPLEGLGRASRPSRPADLRYAIVVSAGMGGQNAALVLKQVQ